MIRIDQRAPVSNATAAGGVRRNSGAGFSLPTQGGTGTARSSAAMATSSLDGLLAVQADEDSGQRKRRQAKRGSDLLDGLDQIRAALLGGRIDAVRLQQLGDTLALRRETTDDPRLDDVLAHIELRTAVELAKFGR